MGIKAIVGSVWGWRWHPIVAGAVVGLVTGLVGMQALAGILPNGAGGLAGAVGCGVTVGYLSEKRLYELVWDAVIADVVSSIVFFILVLVAYITMVGMTENIGIIGAIYISMLYLGIGGAIAVGVGVVSLIITACSAAIAALVMQRTGRRSALE